jgi:hypothetical protein
MFPFIPLVISAATGLNCNIALNDARENWRISTDTRMFQARSGDTVKRGPAMLDIYMGYPEAFEFWIDDRLLMVTLNGNAFTTPLNGTERKWVGHCKQAPFEGL